MIGRTLGHYEIYVRAFSNAAGKWQVSTGLQREAGREIFYRNGDKMMAVSVDTEPTFRAGKPALLFEGTFNGSENATGPHYDVAPDGEHFIMVQEKPQTQIHVVQNGFEELKARAPTHSR